MKKLLFILLLFAVQFVTAQRTDSLGTVLTGTWQATVIADTYISSAATWNAKASTSGNVATATALQTARTINGVSFDGTTNITITAAAGTLTGITLNSTVTASSLTSFGASIALGTPASGNLANCTFPTLNQNTSGTSVNITASSNTTLTSLANLVTIGTVTTGVWNGSLITGTFGGTGVNNGSSTITLAGNFITSGAFSITLTSTATTSVTLPTSGTLVNTSVTTLASLAITESQVTNLTTDLATKAPLASPAFTGTATGIGLPVYAQVTGSNFTTTGQTLVDITGLSVALTTSATYEFEAVLIVNTSAVTTGCEYGVNYSVSGGTVVAALQGSSSTTTDKSEDISALNTASSAYIVGSSENGQIHIHGRIVTTTNAGNLTIKTLKVTSGTSTVLIGSFLKVTRIL